MATVIRLQRHGRKNYPFYKIVVADRRAPRDGRFIENIGTYNPNTNPATLDIKFDRALYWVNVGAQPSDTARSLLSREGVMLMKHLQKGVRKGALTEEQAQERFEAWKRDKNAGIEELMKKEAEAKKAEAKKALEAEKEVNKAKAEALAAKRAEEAAAQKAEEETAAEESEEATSEEAATEEA
ncbi:MAG: 30S ribosomal protein S16 [Porphyromonas sp.]|nr:30S ribosomal protein S16 [Porphyromonas sp.]